MALIRNFDHSFIVFEPSQFQASSGEQFHQMLFIGKMNLANTRELTFRYVGACKLVNAVTQ